MKKDVQVNWTPSHEKQFNIIKQAISSTAILRYFHVNKPVSLQVDASKIGLEVAILQDDAPVAYCGIIYCIWTLSAYAVSHSTFF